MRYAAILAAAAMLSACSLDWAMTKAVPGRPGCYQSLYGVQCLQANR